MRRREVLFGGLAGAAAWARVVAAQQPMPVVGFLHSQGPTWFPRYIAAVRDGLQQAGYVEGQNVAIEYRWADGDDTKLASLAADLVVRRVAVIATFGGPAAARAAKEATGMIPIIFVVGVNPVELRLVTSLKRPGGNATGVSVLTSELDSKRLGLLRELVPHGGHVAVLLDANSLGSAHQLNDVTAAARAAGQEIKVLHAANTTDLDTVLSKLPGADIRALLIGASPFFASQRDRIVDLISGLSLPAIYETREFVEVGGLMSYGSSFADADRQAGIYVGRVLKGEKPADLPVVQSAKFELVINLKTAAALGIAVPQLLLAQANEVIE